MVSGSLSENRISFLEENGPAPIVKEKTVNYTPISVRYEPQRGKTIMKTST